MTRLLMGAVGAIALAGCMTNDTDAGPAADGVARHAPVRGRGAARTQGLDLTHLAQGAAGFEIVDFAIVETEPSGEHLPGVPAETRRRGCRHHRRSRCVPGRSGVASLLPALVELSDSSPLAARASRSLTL